LPLHGPARPHVREPRSAWKRATTSSQDLDIACGDPDTKRVVADFVDRALAGRAEPAERTFWLDSLVTVIQARDPAQHAALFAAAARRIEATFLRMRRKAVTP